VEEVPSSVRTIIGVGTSVTAFVGRALKGSTEEAIAIRSFADYERLYGGLWTKSNMSYAVDQYLINGGKDAVILRVYHKCISGETEVEGKAVFSRTDFEGVFKAANPGAWGKKLQIKISHDVDASLLSADKTLFNLAVTDMGSGQVETFLNASTNPHSNRYVATLLEQESNLIRISPKSGATSFDNEQPPADAGSTAFALQDGTASDGDELTSADVVNSLGKLEKVDLINLLCIPSFKDNASIADRKAAYAEALSYCKRKRAILIVDPPESWVDKDDAANGIDAVGDEKYVERRENAAIYFPRIMAPDSLNGNRLRAFDPCGAVAGVIARTDSQRGVWKAPAGMEATLLGIADLQVQLTDSENGELNTLGINCLRLMPIAGLVVWGARTMRGDDRLEDQWKYLPVRRTALYIEESLFRGTLWVVHEPNDERLWSQIRLNVGAFMHNLFRQGAFQGTTPKDAYFVKCDGETTTQYDIDRGIVNIVVGFAPLKPAEFVIIKIQQIAGEQAL
jgi:hypothetical protein